jgi:acyl-CoA dehydrogenase
MLAITRLWNAVSSASGMRRAYALARDYAEQRVAFGRRLIDQPLHQTTLAWMRAQVEAANQLTFRAVHLLGREESGVITDEEQRLLRILLPVAKLTTGKQAVAVASEGLEAFGGAGYVEDTHLPVLLRDAQVLPIWEGTTNVLSLDALRALQREDAFPAFVAEVHRAAGAAEHADLAPVARAATAAVDHAAAWISEAMAGPGIDAVQHGARRWALTLGRSLQAALLCEQAQHDRDRHGDARGVAVARRFAAEPLDLLEDAGALQAADAAIVEA